MQSEEVLELMRSAPERYDTVRATLRYAGDGSTIKAVRERFLRSEAGRSTFGGPPEQACSQTLRSMAVATLRRIVATFGPPVAEGRLR